MKKICAAVFVGILGLCAFVSGQDGAAPVDGVDTVLESGIDSTHVGGVDTVVVDADSLNAEILRSIFPVPPRGRAAAPFAGVDSPESADSARAVGIAVDQAAIESLFGVFSPDTGEAKDTARVLPPFHGDYRVLVARPAYALYDDEDGTEWISAIGEVYAHYKVGSFPRTYVFPKEHVDDLLPNSRGHDRRLGRQLVIDAARKLGATHIIFQLYQPMSGFSKEGGDDTTRYAMELYWVQEAASVARTPVLALAYSDFERGLDSLLGTIAVAMDSAAVGTAAFGLSFMGGDRGFLEAFGTVLAGEGEFSRERAAAVYAAADSLIRANSALVGVRYAAALLAGRAGDYRRAVDYISAVAGVSGEYPALFLRVAEYLRGAGHYREAAEAAEMAARVGALGVPSSMEMAMILEAQGDIARARAIYDAILPSGRANGRAYFGAAMLAARAGDFIGSENYVNSAEESGFGLGRSEYYRLGMAYAGRRGDEETAVKYFKKSLGPTMSNDSVWLAIAELYARDGKKELEADVYVQLFRSNARANSDTNAYSEKLKLAGSAYESLGRFQKARDAYFLYWGMDPADTDVAMRLARVLVKLQDCQRLPDVLVPLPGNRRIRQMLKECGFREDGTPDPKRGNQGLPIAFITRVSGATLAVAGVTGGLYYNGRANTEAQKYNKLWRSAGDDSAERDAKLKKMRKNIDSAAQTRNAFYMISAVGLGAFTISFQF